MTAPRLRSDRGVVRSAPGPGGRPAPSAAEARSSARRSARWAWAVANVPDQDPALAIGAMEALELMGATLTPQAVRGRLRATGRAA